ncbi:MAG: alpha-galactosidase [Clostridia bacterium]|nr:alpha-galactosidase [Clostridia bacterium]
MIKRFIFEDPKKLPISFKYNGSGENNILRGIPESFNPTVISKTKNGVTKTVFSGMNSDGLEVTFECTIYEEFPVVEYIAYITNKAETDSKLIRDLRVFDGFIEGANPRITYSTGDTHDQRGYEVRCEELAERIMLEPVYGTACNGASPFIKLRFDEFELRLAIGWIGKWKAFFQTAKFDNYGVVFYAGQSRCNMKLRPGETIRTPSLTLMCCNLNDTDSTNLWRRWFRKYIMPKVNGKAFPPMHIVCAPVSGFPEWCGASAAQQLEELEKHAAKGDVGDVWWIDAGWYDCGTNWGHTGNWYPDPNRFPEGLGAIGKKSAELNTRFLLWFEPERVRPNTELYKEHSEWVLKSDGADIGGNGLLNYAIPECVDWTIDRIDNIIKSSKVTIYREDFNFNPEPYWIKYETQERIGALENAHVQGHMRLWDTLSKRNPELLFDVCASGGRRNEMDLLRRGVPFHYTDVGYGSHTIKQKQYRFLNEWTMYYRSHISDWRDACNRYIPHNQRKADVFTYVCSLAPAVQLGSPCNEDDKKLNNSFKAIWKKVSPIMLDGNFYPLTECKNRTSDFYAEQFEIPEEGIGFFRVISNVDNESQEKTFNIHFDSTRQYELSDSFGEGSLRITADGKLEAKLEKAQGIIQIYEFK